MINDNLLAGVPASVHCPLALIARRKIARFMCFSTISDSLLYTCWVFRGMMSLNCWYSLSKMCISHLENKNAIRKKVPKYKLIFLTCGKRN